MKSALTQQKKMAAASFLKQLPPYSSSKA